MVQHAQRDPAEVDAPAPVRTWLETDELPGVALAEGGTCTVRIREAAGSAAALDAARLLVVDHPSDLRPYAVGEAFVLGARQSAVRITAASEADLTATLDGSGSFSLGAGDTLEVELGPDGASCPVVVEASGSGALTLAVPDGLDGWRAVEQRFPRSAPDELAFAAPGAGRLRLVSQGNARLSFVGRLAAASTAPTVRQAELLAAKSPRVGDVAVAIASADSVSATLVGPDTLALAYSVPTLAEGAARDYFLVVDATPLDPRTLTPLQLRPEKATLPTRFALRQNQPNPFRATTSIRFDLPVGAMVRLELFDAAGRRVGTLANQYFPAGRQAVDWTPSAPGVGPGVYFYRLEAGPFRDRKKMVLQ